MFQDKAGFGRQGQYCELVDAVTVTVEHAERFWIEDDKTSVVFDYTDGDELLLYGEPVARLIGEIVF